MYSDPIFRHFNLSEVKKPKVFSMSMVISAELFFVVVTSFYPQATNVTNNVIRKFFYTVVIGMKAFLGDLEMVGNSKLFNL